MHASAQSISLPYKSFLLGEPLGVRQITARAPIMCNIQILSSCSENNHIVYLTKKKKRKKRDICWDIRIVVFFSVESELQQSTSSIFVQFKVAGLPLFARINLTYSKWTTLNRCASFILLVCAALHTSLIPSRIGPNLCKQLLVNSRSDLEYSLLD